MEIPRVLHRIWLGGAPMPEAFLTWGEAWRRLHPGWEHRLWDEESLPPLRNRRLFERAAKVVGSARVGQFRADLLRYEILYRYGGVYVDCDFEPLRPIDDLARDASSPGAFAAWEESGRWVGNAILAAAAGHLFFGRLVAGLRHSCSLARHPAVPGRISGPQYLTRTWRRSGRDSLRVYPKGLFYPYSWDELGRRGEVFPEAFAVHHWANKRREAGIGFAA